MNPSPRPRPPLPSPGSELNDFRGNFLSGVEVWPFAYQPCVTMYDPDAFALSLARRPSEKLATGSLGSGTTTI